MDTNTEKKMKELAKQAIVANKAKNAATKDESDARKELLVIMLEAGVETKSFNVVIDGEHKTLTTKRVRSVKTGIDVRMLSKLVDPKMFWSMISATKSAVVKAAGSNIADKVAVTSDGSESVKVTASK